jgi:dGTP triphosphohydrolase
LHDLFGILLGELVEKKSCALFPRYYRELVEDAMRAGEPEAARCVCNFLALLTDMDALRLHALLRGSKASSVFDLL